MYGSLLGTDSITNSSCATSSPMPALEAEPISATRSPTSNSSCLVDASTTATSVSTSCSPPLTAAATFCGVEFAFFFFVEFVWFGRASLLTFFRLEVFLWYLMVGRCFHLLGWPQFASLMVVAHSFLKEFLLSHAPSNILWCSLTTTSCQSEFFLGCWFPLILTAIT